MASENYQLNLSKGHLYAYMQFIHVIYMQYIG